MDLYSEKSQILRGLQEDIGWYLLRFIFNFHPLIEHCKIMKNFIQVEAFIRTKLPGVCGYPDQKPGRFEYNE